MGFYDMPSIYSPANHIDWGNIRLDPQAKTEWLDALESDTYKDKQGKSVLVTPEGNFCCLGVWCDLKEIPSKVEEKEIPAGESGKYITAQVRTFYSSERDMEFGMNGTVAYIPFLAGIRTENEWGLTPSPTFTGGEILFTCWTQDDNGNKAHFQAYNLPHLNDNGFTFSQIADIIRYCL